MKMYTKLVRYITGVYSTKMILVVRTDLKMGRGKIASQCAHAAVSLFNSALTSKPTALKHWLISGQPKIILKVDTECESTLRKLYDEAKQIGLNACLVHDAGKTQVSQGTVTVLGIGPDSTDTVDKITNHLKLL